MKAIKIILLSLLTLIIYIAIHQYFLGTFYYFPKPIPFGGNQLYNPYADINSGTWVKCNFHAHSTAWSGLTNGEGGTDTVWDTYDSLGYSIHCVSQYQLIDTTNREKENYLPAYEHGYNIRKTHQLVLGDHKTLRFDYIFPQTLSNKQSILNSLKENDSSVVILNHPQLRSGYTCRDMRYLDSYECLEVLNPSVNSFAHWDAALSAGKPVFIVGNDDTHNIYRLDNIGRECTWLNVRKLNKQNVLSALKKGQGYGMTVGKLNGETLCARTRRLKYELPVLKEFHLRGDTISFLMSKKAEQIQFFGQNGRMLADTTHTSSASYIIRKEDHYVRTAIIFEDNTAIYLNPVFRYTKDPFIKNQKPFVNKTKTLLFHLRGAVLVVIWAVAALTFIRYKQL